VVCRCGFDGYRQRFLNECDRSVRGLGRQLCRLRCGARFRRFGGCRGQEAKFLLRRSLRLVSLLARSALAAFATAASTIATTLAFRAGPASLALR